MKGNNLCCKRSWLIRGVIVGYLLGLSYFVIGVMTHSHPPRHLTYESIQAGAVR